MFSLIKQMCATSLVYGAVMALCPEGGVKRVANIVCTMALAAMLLNAFSSFDLETYAAELKSYKEREMEIVDAGKKIEDNLSRLVIEEQYETYILDKATELGLELNQVKLQLRWDSNGFWIAESVEMDCGYSAKLAEYIEKELGIVKQRQRWMEYD